MKKTKKLSGQSLVEFSLLLPLLMVLIMGLFDIGRAVLYYAVMNTAAREGTRYAIVNSNSGYIEGEKTISCDTPVTTTDVNICNEIKSKFFNIGDLYRSTITISYSPQYDNDTSVQVGIELAYRPITPGLGLIGDFTMNANSKMVLTPLAKP